MVRGHPGPPREPEGLSRSGALASQLEKAVQGLAEYTAGLMPDQWRAICGNHPEIRLGEDEHRPVGGVVHHVVEWFEWQQENLQASAAGRPLPPVPMGDAAHFNASLAEAEPEPDQRVTVARLRRRGGATAALIRSLSDADLERERPSKMVPTVEQFIRRVVLGHLEQHLLSIRTTLEP